MALLNFYQFTPVDAHGIPYFLQAINYRLDNFLSC